MATLLGAAVVAVVVILVGVVTFLGAAASARHRAQSAADLAALAAAQRVLFGEADPCGAARSLAAESGAVVARCRRDVDDVVVTVKIRVALGPFGIRDAVAIARAGPTE
ncbi:Rv3654c family TadE-like protein [Williamsia sp. CHRR-6]|uniref:Rv3654c family TadE-like protein n=1 Tax=Williamsia sp. CHRR-6 TaxID=2835871 RepID=UPI0027DC0695|nr:Rv3654c family TadE-like protein [Williamsia sp. CHRR-6]